MAPLLSLAIQTSSAGKSSPCAAATQGITVIETRNWDQMGIFLVSMETVMAFAEQIEPGMSGVFFSERTVAFVDVIQDGLPVAVAEDIAARLAPDDPSFRYQ